MSLTTLDILLWIVTPFWMADREPRNAICERHNNTNAASEWWDTIMPCWCWHWHWYWCPTLNREGKRNAVDYNTITKYYTIFSYSFLSFLCKSRGWVTFRLTSVPWKKRKVIGKYSDQFQLIGYGLSWWCLSLLHVITPHSYMTNFILIHGYFSENVCRININTFAKEKGIMSSARFSSRHDWLMPHLQILLRSISLARLRTSSRNVMCTYPSKIITWDG
jgi:hypothetical protein